MSNVQKIRVNRSGLRCWIGLSLGRAGLGKTAENISVKDVEILSALSGQSVAIVGNSRALADQIYGSDIESAGLVVRINRAPIFRVSSHGNRTDWLALATSLSIAQFRRIAPGRLLWMSHKRKRLKPWMAMLGGFYLHPVEQFSRLRKTLSAPPSTGLMVIELVVRSKARAINIYGFDFFASQSLTGRRSAAQVPHDFAAEKKWLDDLVQRDPRITVFE